MTTLQISLPDDMRSFVEAQTTRDGHASASEFFQSLIRAEPERRARRELDGLLQTALEHGPATPMTRTDWSTLEAQVWSDTRPIRGGWIFNIAINNQLLAQLDQVRCLDDDQSKIRNPSWAKC